MESSRIPSKRSTTPSDIQPSKLMKADMSSPLVAEIKEVEQIPEPEPVVDPEEEKKKKRREKLEQWKKEKLAAKEAEPVQEPEPPKGIFTLTQLKRK